LGNNFCLFFILYVFGLYDKECKIFCFHHTDKGASHPMEMSALGNHGDAQEVA
jgi:hypothetical protein